MGVDLELIKPSFDLEREYQSFYQEWVESGEHMYPWVIEKDPSNFKKMVQFLFDNENGVNLPNGFVPSSTYWLVNENKKILGVVNIRHLLSEYLLNRGGHIGYGIRPSERQKGYAAKLLALSLQKVKALGVEKALLICDETNMGSYRTIVKNGGIPDADFIEEDGNVLKRFWIEL